MAKIAPGPQGHPIIGMLREMRRDPIRFFMESTRDYGDVVRFRVGPYTLHLFRHPDHVKHVLQDNNRNYGRQTKGYQKLALALGQGLVTSEGEFWRRQRRIAQPAFHRERIAHFAEQMVHAADTTVTRWKDLSRRSEPVDVAREMMRLTLEVVATTIFSVDVSDVAAVIGNDVTTVLKYVTDRITSVLGFFEEIPTPANRKFRHALGRLDAFVYRTIEERRRSGEDPGDLLSMLMKARDEETGEGMSDKQLRDELITMFGAGHETTANALTWTFYLLSKHPTIERRLFEEVATVLGGRLPELADLEKLPFLRNVIRESMRILPPVWTIGRSAVADDEIGGYHIPGGSFVFVSPYVTHRYRALWDNPEGFDPDRFATDRARDLPRFAYFPFGGGPHLCIGNSFALMEAELVLATIIARFRLDLVAGHPLDMEPTITLRPRHGMAMHLVPRI
jgi:cytochrome P450